MVGKERSAEIVHQLLALSDADQTEAALWASDTALTRFANNVIHQNVAETNTEISVRVVYGKQIGIAGTNRLDEESLKAVIARAKEIATLSPPKKDFVSLPEPDALHYVDSYREEVAAMAPALRAELVGKVLASARRDQVTAAGALASGGVEFAVANSLGIDAYQTQSVLDFNVVMTGSDSSGWADHYAIGLEGFDPNRLAERAVAKCLRGSGPTDLEPGEYTVILEAAAVGTLIQYLAFMGLDALSYQEGRSFLVGKLGQKLVDERVSLWDDGLDPRGIPLACDFEGVPKQTVHFFRDGVAEGVVYDSATANKEGKRSTGHGLPAGSTSGPLPLNIFLAPGESTVEEMVASTERGVLVTRFHYVNVLEPKRTLLTGMTRDGTFLIENGRLARPINNLRFTHSVLDALSSVEAVGSQLKVQRESVFSATVPALKVSQFNFTGATRGADG